MLALGLSLFLLPQNLELDNVKVWTGTGQPWPAERIVVVDGRIAAPGTAPAEGSVRIDGKGAFVYPGLQDAHGHLLGMGTALGTIDLVGTRSLDEVIAKVRERARTTPKGQWILGRGWDQNDWADKKMPHHAELTAEVSDHPVWLVRIDGHAGFGNLLALRSAGITGDTGSPRGGEILMDEDGEPTGVLVDRAMDLVSLPEPSTEEIRSRLLAAQEHCLKLGLTCVHDAGVGREVVDEMRLLLKAKKWHLRTYLMWSSNERDQIRKGPWRSGDGLLTLRAVKGYADGALGSYGAALLTPYADRPNFRGLMLTPEAGLRELAQLCADAGMQLCTHAIGDAANRAVLDAYAGAKVADRKAARFRIEHAQVVAPADFARFAELAVIPSMQPTHLTSDMPWAPTRLGSERVLGAYAWRSFHALGLPVAFGSDFPVEQADPRIGLFAAVTTAPAAGAAPLRPDQRLDRAAALRGFTLDAAFAAFQEQDLGTIEAGKIADFTVIDRDLVQCGEAEILTAPIAYTVVGGRVAFAAR